MYSVFFFNFTWYSEKNCDCKDHLIVGLPATWSIGKLSGLVPMDSLCNQNKTPHNLVIGATTVACSYKKAFN